MRRARVSGPVARCDLVGDQAVGGLVIGNAKQALRQTHQRDAFLIGQRELLEERVEQRPFARSGAGAADQLSCPGFGAGPCIERQARAFQQGFDASGLVLKRRTSDLLAELLERRGGGDG
ncbi:hypothetical protein GCM10011487_07830 [Steroidobacter agaridevorans]|uniref:Uncharacterized protein n=1 Tax=Steroidobacter agaridevorans TaxID=2695856 RepID=A0A829Y6V4_9GAMM|nr:hypothetical protein GCM10011487_07830 [Steroidobacter agaridevorans]